MVINDYVKGGNKGRIVKQGDKYLAVTAIKSNWYKTLKGAENFMTKNNYTLKGDA